MTTTDTNGLPELGILRSALLIGALINMLLPAIGLALSLVTEWSDSGLWSAIVIFITPVMAPIFVVVIFFDYVMSRLRASDTEAGEEQCAHFAAVARIEMTAILLSLVFWVPYFIWKL